MGLRGNQIWSFGWGLLRDVLGRKVWDGDRWRAERDYLWWGGYCWWECIDSSMDWDACQSLFPRTLIHSCHPFISKGDMQVSCTVFFVVVVYPEITNNIFPPMNIWSQKTVSMEKPIFPLLIHFENLFVMFLLNVCWNRDWWFHGLQHLICWPCFFWNTESHWRHGVFKSYLELFQGCLIATPSWRKAFFFCPCLRCCGVL